MRRHWLGIGGALLYYWGHYYTIGGTTILLGALWLGSGGHYGCGVRGGVASYKGLIHTVFLKCTILS